MKLTNLVHYHSQGLVIRFELGWKLNKSICCEMMPTGVRKEESLELGNYLSRQRDKNGRFCGKQLFAWYKPIFPPLIVQLLGIYNVFMNIIGLAKCIFTLTVIHQRSLQEHRKSGKPPWHHNVFLSFFFVFLSFYLFVFLSFYSQVSRVTLFVQILKWRSVNKWLTTKVR